MDRDASRTGRPPPIKRVSNACLQCRSRHTKCDSTTPVCGRCQEERIECVYLKSRRGGVRRRGVRGPPPSISQLDVSSLESDQSLPESQPQLQPPPTIERILENRVDDSARVYPNTGSLPFQSTGAERLGTTQCDAGDFETGILSLYYSFFHTAHPCVLPQWSLRLRAALHLESLATLIPVLQYIGSLYSPSISSGLLEGKVLEVLDAARARGGNLSPFEIQAVILYSIAVYWCDEIERSLELLGEAIRNALEIGMHEEEFAARNGEGDPVLEESWRRTWWQIYLAASHMSGSTHTFPSKVEGIVMTARLPCEEEYYESGSIPPPRTLDEYDMREFQPPNDCGFSSFAELIGLARSLDLVLSERTLITSDLAKRVSANADTTILAWLLLLPRRKQVLVRDNGTVDEQIFRAHMLIYAYIVDLNRELSELLYNSMESVSRRAPRPPPESRDFRWGPFNPKTRLHTTKVLAAIEKMNGLLTLPTHLSLHTPFIICMIANTAIAHLSAYKWIYPGARLQIERERIRMIVGVLKMLSEYWPLGKRTYREIVAIARNTLQIDDEDITGGAGAAGAGVGGLGYMEGELGESMRDFLQTAAAFSLAGAD